MNKNHKAFSLIELLLYMAIFVTAAGIFTAILVNVLKINISETSGAEVTMQLNSVMQTINRLVKESSNIEIATSTVSTLKLRMNEQAKDPTCVYISGGVVKLAQGPDVINPQNCASNASDLTTSKVNVDNLQFKKLTYYPGHDQVIIDIQMSYNSPNPEAKISRVLHSAISRVSAATFDAPLLPGSDNSYEIGYSLNQRWRNLFLSGGINDLLYFLGSNIGIGTNNPGAKLHIFDSSPKIIIQDNDNAMTESAASAYLTFWDKNGAQMGYVGDGGSGQNITLGGETGYSLTFSAGGVSRILIASSTGNVGIGTTDPVNSKLRVKAGSVSYNLYNRGLSVEGDNSTFLSMGIDNSLGTNGRAWITAAKQGVAMLDILLAPEGGNVGIGITAPSEKLEVNGNVKAAAFLYSSDYNLKKNIQPLSNQLEKVLKLQGVSYDWKDNNNHDIGLIAQDVEKIFPEVVYTNKETGLKSVDYAKLTVFLVEAIKEQQQQHQKDIEYLKIEIEKLKANK